MDDWLSSSARSVCSVGIASPHRILFGDTPSGYLMLLFSNFSVIQSMFGHRILFDDTPSGDFMVLFSNFSVIQSMFL